MAILQRLIVLFPLALSIVGMVLSALCLFAGHEEGFMEDYAIARLNTSMVGHEIFNFTADGEELNQEEESDSDEDEDSSWFDNITDPITDTASDAWDDTLAFVEDTLNDATASAADAVAEALGISEWFSLHVMTACQGMYTPDASANDAGFNITSCTDAAPDNRLDLEDMLGSELSAGPIDITLEDINWPDEVQDAIDLLNTALLALFVLYVLVMAFSGIAILGTVGAFFAPGSRALVLTNMVVSFLAALLSAVASILITVALTEGMDELNKYTEDFGIEGQRGDGFLGLTWGTTGVLIGAFIFWTTSCCFQRRERKRAMARPRKEPY
jgi:hypothetical protein